MMPAPPTTDLGRPDLIWGNQGQGLMSDWLETTADLIWPLTVRTYGRMRRDPQLTAVLAAYTLPILRANWRVDPAGCREEVVQMVADDLGLPILGIDAKPGPARRRGIAWADHLRLALLSLTFGHMPFERRYEIRNNQARLINLGERMPHTITDIAVNNDGTLRSIRQEPTGTVDIPARRLAWYVHDREGANWAGTSVLRPAYGPWLLKHEMWRVHATSIRRFGMGVPNVKAPAGATPAQVMEAQRLAAAMRVGDQSGVGLPNGFELAITGMQGSVPDAMAYIRYLDQQMSTMALAGLIDLGNTTNGSRALGDTFLDLFLLSLQAVADDIASTATSGHPGTPGIVTDIVDLNWGEDEPAPRIVCADVGENHELNAEALNGLIVSGALHADDDLEAYLRGTYRLPPRAKEDKVIGERSYAYDLDYGILTIDERRAQISLPPLPNGAGAMLPTPSNLRIAPPEESAPTPTPESPKLPATASPSGAGEPVAAARGARAPRRRHGHNIRAAGDETAGNRQLTTTEAASGLDPDAVQTSWQTGLDALIEQWATVSAAQQAELADQIAAAISAGEVTALAGLVVTSAPAAEILATAMIALAVESAGQMIAEAATQGVKIPKPKVDKTRLTEIATTVAELMGESTATTAGREAIRIVGDSTDGKGIAKQVTQHLGTLTDAWPREQLGGALTSAQNHGRMIAIDAAPSVPTLAASEVLDQNTCANCAEIDGHEFETVEAANEAYASGGYVKCLGRLRCRGIVIAVWPDA